MQAYSLDFRHKIIEVYETEKTSVRKLAKRFGIAPSRAWRKFLTLSLMSDV